MATYWGLDGDHGSWGRAFSVEGREEAAAIARRYLAEMEPHFDHPDPDQRLAARSIAMEMEAWIEDHGRGEHFRSLRHLGGPLTTLRSVFSVMPSGTVEEAEAILSRLESVGEAFADIRDTAAEGKSRGIVVARRQVQSVIEQMRHLAGHGSAFVDAAARIEETVDSARLEDALDGARQSAADFAVWLADVYLPAAAVDDGVGAEHYRHALSDQVGKDIDPVDAYQWGWEELWRLISEMERVGEEILPGASWPEVRRHLETDPSGLAHSTDELLTFVREVLDQAVSDLAGTHFEVPDEIRPLTVQLAPPGGALGVYYMSPSEDLSRPGGVWYAIATIGNGTR